MHNKLYQHLWYIFTMVRPLWLEAIQQLLESRRHLTQPSSVHRTQFLGADQPPVGAVQQGAEAVARQHRARQAALRSEAEATARRQAQSEKGRTKFGFRSLYLARGKLAPRPLDQRALPDESSFLVHRKRSPECDL